MLAKKSDKIDDVTNKKNGRKCKVRNWTRWEVSALIKAGCAIEERNELPNPVKENFISKWLKKFLLEYSKNPLTWSNDSDNYSVHESIANRCTHSDPDDHVVVKDIENQNKGLKSFPLWDKYSYYRRELRKLYAKYWNLFGKTEHSGKVITDGLRMVKEECYLESWIEKNKDKNITLMPPMPADWEPSVLWQAFLDFGPSGENYDTLKTGGHPEMIVM